MAATFMLKQSIPIAALAFAERYAVNYHSEVLLGLADTWSGPVSRAYGLVIGVNLVASGFVLIYLATRVGAARKKYKVELPQLYASGDSKEAKIFNCIQRAHQQALETYPQFLACSLVGGIRNPIATSLFGLVWCVARVKWAEGYSTGEPDARYSYSWWGRHIWTGLLGVLGMSISTMFDVLGIF